jgi:hypothetical protein
MRIDTHLFLVHEDMIPNITPAIDPAFSPKEVFLLCSPDSIVQTQRLELILKQSGINVSRWPVNDAWDIEHIRERVLEFVANHDHIDIALNVTGGTKPMSLAAYEIFKDIGKPVYYVQTDRDYVVWLNPRDQESFDLADRIKLPAYFTAYGMRLSGIVKKDAIPKSTLILTETLVQNIASFAEPLLSLNSLISQMGERLVSHALTKTQIASKELHNILDLLVKHDLINIDNHNRLCFSSQESRHFINGGWLEEHIYGVLFRLQQALPAIQDLARNVNIEWDVKTGW